MKQWVPTPGDGSRPRYVEIAEAIKADIDRGVLSPGDRLPSQRGVAQELGLDLSAVSRGYAEAVRRGYVESFVGRGTFVSEQAVAQAPKPDPRRGADEGPMMNMPPEPDDPDLLAQMQEGVARVGAGIVPLLRYQSVIGSQPDREILCDWMHTNGVNTAFERLTITPGAHASICAILNIISEPGLVVLCEDLTYPGIRAIAARMGLRLVGVESDADGVRPDALERAIREHWPSALYLNPTLQNPTTGTIPEDRREAIAKVLRDHNLPLIEDDAYCFVAEGAPAPITDRLPGLGWHVAGISKCFGAGLRLACTTVPTAELMGPFVQALRSIHVMASPFSLALLCHWIQDGTAARLQDFVRSAAAERQALAASLLSKCDARGAGSAFNLWLTLPSGTTRAELMGRMAQRRIGIMPSDAFATSGPAPEAVRVCLGGPLSMTQLREDLLSLNDAVLRKDWLG